MAGYSNRTYSEYKVKNLVSLAILAVFIVILLELTSNVILPFFSGEGSWGCPPFPWTLSAVASEIGGTSDQWVKAGQSSWTYTGANILTFRIPDGCVFDSKRAGDTISISRGDTIMWPKPS